MEEELYVHWKELKPGSRITFAEASDAQVSWGGGDDPREHLEWGETYTVKNIDVRSWHTKITLEEFPSLRFNSVCFTYA